MESIKISDKDRVAIALLIFVTILGTALVEFFIYDGTRTRLLNEIQERMLIASHATAAILGDNYHDGLASGISSISIDQEYQDALILSEFTSESELDYTYTIIKPADDILFVSSSLTPEELSNESAYQAVFLTSYDDAPPELYEVFETGEIGSSIYKDQWGEFLSVFAPKVSNDGSLYVVGVDMSIDHYLAESKINAFIALGPLFLIIILAAPIIWLISSSLKRQASLEISRLFTDNVTGLANRNRLMQDLETDSSAILFIVNIDKFREISNTYGPAIGDIVLRQFGRHLELFHHPKIKSHLCYRLQGDEFSVLIQKAFVITDRHRLSEIFYDYVNSFKYIGMDGKHVSISVTVGVAISQPDITLLADMALRHAKHTGTGLVIYDDEMGIPEIYKNNLENIEKLRSAIDDNRIIPYFQPIIRCSDNSISHYEVLARVIDTEGNVCMNPVDFIPLAKRYRLYNRVTKAVLEQTIRIMRTSESKVCFNLSSRDIENRKSSNYILETIKRSGMANRISIELLENDSINNPKSISRFFIKMRAMGCKVGIDDLGKDYSNFDRVIQLPIDFIKIDGAVIHHAAKDNGTFDVVEKIVMASKSKGLFTVAERIDSDEIIEVAKNLGVDYLQGFGVGLPMPYFIEEPENKIESIEKAS